jgi:hypothetical protein
MARGYYTTETGVESQMMVARPQNQRESWSLSAGFFALAIDLLVYDLYITGYSPDPPQSGLILSFGFYTILATWGVIVYQLLRRPAVPKPLVQLEST